MGVVVEVSGRSVYCMMTSGILRKVEIWWSMLAWWFYAKQILSGVGILGDLLFKGGRRGKESKV